MSGTGAGAEPPTAKDLLAEDGHGEDGHGEDVPVELDRPGPRLRFQAGRFQPDPDLRGEPLPPGYRAAHVVGATLLVMLGLAVLAAVIGLGLPALVWNTAAWFIQLLPFVP